jgi:hypothetical protein
MTGMIRKATILVALGLVASSAAMAGIPSPANSTIPACIKVVGTNSVGVADPVGLSSVTVLDVAGNPVANAEVTLDFAACNDMKVCTVGSVGTVPPVTTVVPVVSAFTNAQGVATFTVVGAAMHPGTPGFAGPGADCIEIRAAGILLGYATSIEFDLDGAFGAYSGNGVAIVDLPTWLLDWAGGTAPYVGRADYNCSGDVSILDLPEWLLVWGPLGSAFGCPGAAF